MIIKLAQHGQSVATELGEGTGRRGAEGAEAQPLIIPSLGWKHPLFMSFMSFSAWRTWNIEDEVFKGP